MFVALAVSLAAGATALAAPSGGLEYAPPAPPSPPDLGGLVVRLVVMTAALMALCGAVMWFARRANRPVGGVGDGAGRLKLEGTLVLDRRCAVHMLLVDGQSVALTTDATGLRSLAVLSEPFDAELEAAQGPLATSVTEAEPPAAVAPAAPSWSADDVRQLLQRVVRRTDGPGVHLEPALGHDQA